MHGPNRTHNTKDCFELKRRAKRAKTDTSRDGAEKVSYKDLNAFVNAKVTAALKKAKAQKKKEKKVTINAFDNFRNLRVEDSSEEESDHEVNALANASDDDSDSGASRVESDESDSDDE
jgi:ABC-type Zn2+ transport system substrate-binding protein/surface adhesin